MTNEYAKKVLTELRGYGDKFANIGFDRKEALDMAIKALEQQQRDCNTCKHSDNGNCAYTEECHECMWKSKYEQQPCEDCISRQRVLDIINFEYKWLLDAKVYDICTSIAFSAIMSKISEMPSVTPTRPTGKWIKMPLIETGQTYSHKCSTCGRKILTTDAELSKFPYCHCGAKMEVTENADSN